MTFNEGGSYNGSTMVSKTICEGSTPSPPAIFHPDSWGVFVWHDIVQAYVRQIYHHC